MTEARWDADRPLPAPRDRPVTVLHRLEAASVGALWRWSARQPIERASDRLGAFARRAGPRLVRVHARGQRNMALALPDVPEGVRDAALLDAWENLGRTAAEYAHLADLPDRCEIVGAERLAEVAMGGQAIFVAGHFANWEVMGTVMQRSGVKAAVVYRPANNPLVDARIIAARAPVTSRAMIPKGRRGGRDLLRAVKDGLSPCLICDQRLSDGIEADFLGHPALTAQAPAKLALRTGLPIVPIQLVREADARFTLTAHPPLDVARTGEPQADTLAITQAVNDALGRFVRERAGQWLWFHRRWKPR